MSNFNPIQYTEKTPVRTLVQACANLVNWLCMEMSQGRVLQEEQERKEAIQNLRLPMSVAFVALAEQGALGDTTAMEHAALFGQWQKNVAYVPGNLRIDPLNGCLYRCNPGKGHTSVEGWNPSLTPDLWTLVGDPAAEWPQWSQPIGVHDAYQVGDRVSYQNAHWVSTAANNVWAPGVYGWDMADERDNE